jgi:hypothetical protein
VIIIRDQTTYNAADMCAGELAIGARRYPQHARTERALASVQYAKRRFGIGVLSNERSVVVAIRRWPNGMHDAWLQRLASIVDCEATGRESTRTQRGAIGSVAPSATLLGSVEAPTARVRSDSRSAPRGPTGSGVPRAVSAASAVHLIVMHRCVLTVLALVTEDRAARRLPSEVPRVRRLC